MGETVQRMQLEGTVIGADAARGASTSAPAAFEILAITAGEGNGWQFSAEVLRSSLAKWQGVDCFLDHASLGRAKGSHSVRDLAGVLSAPSWDEAHEGVRAQLTPLGEAGNTLRQLGQQVTALGVESRPRLGFSADLIFKADGKQVKEVVQVVSVDLVSRPARGGAFIRSLNSTLANQEGAEMAESLHETANPQEERVTLAETQASLCAALLESTLAGARLPSAMALRVRKQFEGQVFAPATLKSAVEDARKLVSDLTGGAVVIGAARVEHMADERDQFCAAMHDLFEVERPAGLRGVDAARLSGIREMYIRATGDLSFAGGYSAEQAQFSTTADLPGVLKNVLNKVIAQEWQALGNTGYHWWQAVVSQQHFDNLQPITGVLVSEVAELPSVNEGEAYPALAISDNAETGAWGKYGGYIGLTLEMFERDETHRLRQLPRKLAAAGQRRISKMIGSIFTANSGAGPLMSDGYAVFEAAHHHNLGTDALSAAAWEAASAAVYAQPMLISSGNAPILGADPRYLLVPRSLRLTAQRILYPSWEREAQIVSQNMQRGQAGDVIVCPELSGTHWAAVVDPKIAPSIILAERFGVAPEIILADQEKSGALFSNDEVRMKARHWFSVFVADYRGLYQAHG